MKWKLIYVIVWSFGLFFATFPTIVKSEFDFSLRTLSQEDLIDKYIIPLMMAMAMFLLDALYAYRIDQSIGKNNSFVSLFIAEIAFLVAFALSLFGGKTLSLIMFILAWLSMSLMKFTTTPVIENMPKRREARVILSN